jgi:hypothetical protein
MLVKGPQSPERRNSTRIPKLEGLDDALILKDLCYDPLPPVVSAMNVIAVTLWSLSEASHSG